MQPTYDSQAILKILQLPEKSDSEPMPLFLKKLFMCWDTLDAAPRPPDFNAESSNNRS